MHTMANADEIRAGLIQAAKRREAADRERERATAELVALLRAVHDAEGITMSEAAELIGVSRVMAYKML
jgi:hypothetical protein